MDCDGSVPSDELVDEDGDGSPVCEDCDDEEALSSPDMTGELCDGLDNNCVSSRSLK